MLLIATRRRHNDISVYRREIVSGAYYVVGRVAAERFAAGENQKEGDIEVHNVQGLSDVLELDEAEEVRCLMYDEADVPKEPGLYILLYAGTFYPYQDYWGEYDVNVEIDWVKVRAITDEKKMAETMEWVI